MIELRIAHTDDIPWIFACCEDFAVFYETKKNLAGNPEYGKKFLAELIEKHFVRVAWDGENRAGFIAGLEVPNHFNPDIQVLTELLWWVPPGYRQTRVGAMLFDAFVEYGKQHCDWITFTLETKSPVKDDFLLRKGFRPHERTFLMECE